MKFKLIHKKTNMTLGEYKNKYSLTYYLNDSLREDNEFQHIPIKSFIREDGAIGLQRLNPWYEEGQIYFLKREEWQIEFRA